MVMIRSPVGIQPESAFKNVVLPEPVPPEIKMLYPALTSISKNLAASSLSVCNSISRFMVIGSFGNFRIVIQEPSIAVGSNTIWTLEPSSNRASAIGIASFTTRLFFPTIFCMTSSSFSLPANCLSHVYNRPAFS